MSALNSRQELIESLLKYIPELSSSLNDLVNYLQKIINDDVEKKENIKPIIKQLNRVLQALQSFAEEVPIKSHESNLNPDILEQHKNGFRSIVLGLKLMLKWLSVENETNEVLTDAINLLFQGGQQIIELVDILTEK